MSRRRRLSQLRRRVVRLLPRSPVRRVALVAGLAALALLAGLNLTVAFLGDTIVFPLSPFHVRSKLHALGKYAAHRPFCLFSGHDDLPAHVAAAARKHRLPAALLAAVVEAESGSRAHRISFAGAMGPAQLVPSTARMLGVRDPFDPAEAIDGGARYLKELLVRFKGDERLAVAAYNAGPGNVIGGRVPQNGETEHYVRRVMALRRATAAVR